MLAAPLLLGHRGSRVNTSVPENTPASFDIALAHGCDGFEFDVRLTCDGRSVVCHDPEVDGVLVCQATTDQLVHLPVLDDILQRYGQRAFLNIELKVPGLESKVLGLLREHKIGENYVVSSFIPQVAMELKTRSASIHVGIICDKPRQFEFWRGSNVEYLIPHYTLITRDLVQEAHNAGSKLFAWTVNDGKAMLLLAGWGVDGIISDDTRLLTQTFA